MKAKLLGILVIVLSLCLTACNDTYMSLTCPVENEVFEFRLDLGDGYQLSQAQNGNVIVLKDENTVLDAQAVPLDSYFSIIETVREVEAVDIFVDEEGIFGYYYDGNGYPETTYLICPDEAAHGFAITNFTSREDGEDAFSRLTVTKVK